jgi:hypothetical protein
MNALVFLLLLLHILSQLYSEHLYLKGFKWTLTAMVINLLFLSLLSRLRLQSGESQTRGI